MHLVLHTFLIALEHVEEDMTLHIPYNHKIITVYIH